MKVNPNKIFNERLKNPTGLPYLNLVIFHTLIGFLIFAFRPLAIVYTFSILIYYILKIMRESHDPLVVLKACSYIAAAEVFLRMTGGLIFYETGKYTVILFIAFGLYYHNFKSSANIFIIFFVLLIPSVVITFLDISFEESFRKTILFNLSGEFCLFACALFCYNRDIKFKDYTKLLDIMLLPIVATATYLVFYTPNLQEVVTGAEGNFAASGGFGPNQVATVLGLGMFILFVRLFLTYNNKVLQFIMYGVLALISFRALATLSRGGVFTAVIMCIFFLFGFLRYAKPVIRTKSLVKIMLITIIGSMVWLASIYATNEMVYNKYTSRNADGSFQEDFTTGRITILETEIDMFESNPFFGIGAGMGKFYRIETMGKLSASHNEITRLISEHGFFGVLCIILLIFAAFNQFLKDPRNIFVLSLTFFWLLTISHSAMRIAAPGLIYGLALLKVKFDHSPKDA
jgi:O-antigen ligase